MSSLEVGHTNFFTFARATMTLLAEFEIPERVRIKKNGKRIFSSKRWGGGRMVVKSSEQYCAWENKAIWALKKAWHPRKPIEMPVEVHFEFHFANHQHEPDTSNCIEGPQDCLQAAHVIMNDKQIQKVVAEKLFGLEPKTIIRIYKIEPKETPNVLRTEAA
jgi:Holliday junction resolvase RusA-like endonuclease